MSALGVEDGITVVIYDDDENVMLATRLWVRAYDAAMAEWANLGGTPLVLEEGVIAAT